MPPEFLVVWPGKKKYRPYFVQSRFPHKCHCKLALNWILQTFPFLLVPRAASYFNFVIFVPAGAVRFFRRIIAIKDDFYNRYIIRGNLVEPVIRTFKNNGNKYNLLNSALIELFEFIRLVSLLTLFAHLILYICFLHFCQKNMYFVW